MELPLETAAQRLLRQLRETNREFANLREPRTNAQSRRLPGATAGSASTTPVTSIENAADLGLLVRQARKAMRMTQSIFAAHAGVGRRFVSELERGKPNLEFNKALACANAAGIDLLARARRG